MSKYIRRAIGIFELSLNDEETTQRLIERLRELVVLLFAVVLAVGLKRIGDAKTIDQFAALALVYSAVILSWWGYNLGIVVGPVETNRLCYVFDCALLILYWCMIHWAFDLTPLTIMFVVMFGLYSLWEVTRYFSTVHPPSYRSVIARAAKTNLGFTVLLLLILAFHRFTLPCSIDTLVIVLLFLLVIIYRFTIGWIYRRGGGAKMSINPKSGVAAVDQSKLVEAARQAATNARVHISNYRVGAAVLSKTGRMYSGCNIEFDNFSNTIHAEEAAIACMVVSGETTPVAIAVYTKGKKVAFPCGMCLQSLYELGGRSLQVIAATDDKTETRSMEALMPYAFSLADE